jgi:hypothetical protein
VGPLFHTAIWANIQLLSLKNSESSSILAIQVTRKETECKTARAISLIFLILEIKIPLIYMVVAVVIEQHLKKSVHKNSTAVCTSSSNSFIHPNFHCPVFGSLFQYQVTFLLIRHLKNHKLMCYINFLGAFLNIDSLGAYAAHINH